LYSIDRCLFTFQSNVRRTLYRVARDAPQHSSVLLATSIPNCTRRTTAQQCTVGNIHTKLHPHPSATAQMQVDINVRPHGTEPLLGRNKYHRDKYVWYQSVNVIACCCCRCGCCCCLATFSTDAVCYSLLQTETQILVLFLLCGLPFPLQNK
jgi:hypothetical protein